MASLGILMVATLCLPTKQTRISYELDEEDEDCTGLDYGYHHEDGDNFVEDDASRWW